MSYDGTLMSTEDFLRTLDPEIKLHIFTLKWGNKYGPEHVNRLYGSLLRYVRTPFSFCCITDDSRGIKKEIQTIDYNQFDPWKEYPQNQIFTREKLAIMDLDIPGVKSWVDLDMLIHDDVTELYNSPLEKPTFIFNYWNADKKMAYKWFGKGSDCHVNSSFVAWRDARWLPKYTEDNKEKLFFTYKSLDKYLYYQHWRNDRLAFWPEGIVDNFNFSDPPHIEREGARITLFNTSHIRANNLNIEAYELDETEGMWPMEYWKSYDKA